MTPKIVVNNFILYGLNRYRNFLFTNGNRECIELEDEREVVFFCCEQMKRTECEAPGMFAVFLDGTYMALTLLYDEEDPDHVRVVIGKKRDMHFFSEFDAAFSLHCYALIYEIRPNEWMIQE